MLRSQNNDRMKRRLHTSMSDCSTVVKSVGRPLRAARASSLAFPAVPPAMEMSLKVVEENTAAEASVARRERMMVDFIMTLKNGIVVVIMNV